MLEVSSFFALKPPSSLSSPFCGQRIFCWMIALSIMLTTKNQTIIRIHAMTQPTMAMEVESNALATANVAVVRAVLGKMKENQFMAKSSSPRAQDQWAPTETRKNQMASLPSLA